MKFCTNTFHALNQGTMSRRSKRDSKCMDEENHANISEMKIKSPSISEQHQKAVSNPVKPSVARSTEKQKKLPVLQQSYIVTLDRGDLVWGKITSHPWWPGLVINHSECCQKVPKEGHVWIFWLGHNTVSEVARKNLMYFFECDQSFFEVISLKRPHYKEGLMMAIKLAAERTGVHLDAESDSEVLQYAVMKWHEEEGHPKQIPGAIPTYVMDVLMHLQTRNQQQQQEASETSTGRFHVDDEILPILEEITSIRDICLVCQKRDTSLENNHPIYEGKVCYPCKGRIKAKMFAVDNTNKFYCSVCTRQGILDCISCPRTFCEICIKVFLPEAIRFKEWKCLVCEPASKNRGLLIVRNNFIQEVSNFFTEDTSDELQKRKRPIVVLSLFDGISTGLLVLQKMGISVKKYYACEVDENAITVSKARFGNCVTHLGNVKLLNTTSLKKLGAIDLLIGGSPCNDLSMANPARRGFSDIDSTALLFYEYYRILQQVEKSQNFFWLFENTANMPIQFEETINRFLQSKPKKIDARFFSAHNRARFFWGNIPALGETCIPASSPDLDEVVNKTFGRTAQVKKMRTITTNANSLMGQGPANILPVIENGKEDTLWITEVEDVFGFPRHFTDVGSLSRKQRLDLLGRSWSVQVVEYILRPLKVIFETSKQSIE